MADSQKALIEEIKNQFPRVIKPVNYANLILEGKSINATNKNNAVSLETVDTDNIKFWDSGFWFLWQSSYGTQVLSSLRRKFSLSKIVGSAL